MKIYLISQTANNDYDTYDSAVVYAPDEETARNTHPYDGKQISWVTPDYAWCKSPDQVGVRYIGEAPEGVEAGLICASFNAG